MHQNKLHIPKNDTIAWSKGLDGFPGEFSLHMDGLLVAISACDWMMPGSLFGHMTKIHTMTVTGSEYTKQRRLALSQPKKYQSQII